MELDSREHNRHRLEDIPAKPEENFVIGISGCTSAGKTTLALLLDVVLREAVCRMASGNHEYNPELPPHTAVIHQDAYFFKDRIERGPMVSVQPLWPEDKLVANMTGPNDPPILVEDRDCVGSCDIELLAKHIDEPDERARTGVPNPRFLTNLQERARIHVEGDEETEDGELERDDISPAAAAAANELAPGTLDAAVEAMRDAFRRDTTRLALKTQHIRLDDAGVPIVPFRFVVVEGFTLFARDAEHDPIGRSSASASDTEAVALRSLRRVQDRFDVALFLPVEREEVRVRRFGRSRYLDVPEGRRREGEGWKSGGYFDQVAWPHYERYHRHILSHLTETYSSDEALREREHGRPWCATNAWERDPCVNGVHVRPAAVSSLDDTLLWASSVVGGVLAARQLQDCDHDS
ncbi:uncharacterized protein GGS22DRAFT_184627 [Annulohypoxylon maeteangense]|uniref:uncharacterized protein n=1 Tax=Annulohypoxylon maeteangense TaxID=1927788 RepID=UPI0020087342|nr:uncharacterized protein GGS22DRAFT_184627 [Annulohypoxylon maeteangense]KAI0889051.1 hypothetical protein GGS22DRAFT_184627 [Annulohypoxylon maeteangense]